MVCRARITARRWVTYHSIYAICRVSDCDRHILLCIRLKFWAPSSSVNLVRHKRPRPSGDSVSNANSQPMSTYQMFPPRINFRFGFSAARRGFVKCGYELCLGETQNRLHSCVFVSHWWLIGWCVAHACRKSIGHQQKWYENVWTKSIDDYIWLIAKLSVLCVLIILLFAESFCKHSRFWWECKQVENNHIILTNVEYEYSTTTSFVCKNNHRIMKKKTTARIKYTHRPRTVDAKIPNILYTLLLLFNP